MYLLFSLFWTGKNKANYFIGTEKYQDFSFYQRIIFTSRAVKILFLSFTREDIGVVMVTNMVSKLQESLLEESM